MSKELSPYPLRSQSRSITSRRVFGSMSQVRSRSQVSSGTSIPAPVLSSTSTVILTMTKFDAIFPSVGTPCSSDEDIAKEMATLTIANSRDRQGGPHQESDPGYCLFGIQVWS